MKKNIKLLLLLFTLLFIFAGCNNLKNESSNSNVEIINGNIVNVNGIDLHIDKEKEFKGIKYTITDDLKEVNQEKYVQYYLYQESGTNLLFFRIFYYEDKTKEYIKNDLAIDSSLIEEKGKTDNIEYTLIDTKRTDGTIHYYIIQKDNVSYVVNFVSQYDINDFENIVLNSIEF